MLALEGGYNLRSIARSMAACVRVLKVRKYLIICALSYSPHTNLHINKSTEV